MKLVTKEIEAELPPLYATEELEADDKVVRFKLFTPDANWTWYIVEGERQENGDLLMFGYVEGLEGEWGYVSLSELESVTGPFGLAIERDIHFEPKRFGELNLETAA